MGNEVSLVSRTAHSTPSVEPTPGEPAPVDVAVLYRAHERTVMRWAARLGGPGIDVEDVVQDVFLVAKRRLASFEGPGNVKTWLFRTTEKIVQAARRKQRLRRWLSRSREPTAPGMGAARPTPAEALESERAIGEVYRVLDRLPTKQRRVLVLFELEGLSTQEIADLVGAQVGTVRVWLFRARARFMEEHQRLFQSEPRPSKNEEGDR
jgi:RNA polymerase sigma-70 factor (ECF subfamily)